MYKIKNNGNSFLNIKMKNIYIYKIICGKRKDSKYHTLLKKNMIDLFYNL